MSLPALRILLAVTIILVISAATVVGIQLRGPQEWDGKHLFPDLAAQAEQVSSLSILSAGKTLTFNRTPSGWSGVENGGYPADGEKLWRAFFGLSALRLVEPKTANPEQYQKLDLRDPTLADSRGLGIRVRDQAGADLAALIVGRRKQAITVLGEGGVYVRRPDDIQSWLASGSLAVRPDPAFWLDPLILSIPVTRIHRLTIRQNDGEGLEIIRKTPEDRRFRIVDRDPAQEANPAALERLGGAFDGLLLDDVRPASKDDFGDDQAVVARLETFDGLEVTARLVTVVSDEKQDQNEPTWAQVRAAALTDQPLAIEEATRLQERLDGWIFRLNPFQAKTLSMTKAGAMQPIGTQAENMMPSETFDFEGPPNGPQYPLPQGQ